MRGAGWALIGFAALELVSREVARKSIVAGNTGLDFSVWTMVAVAVVGAIGVSVGPALPACRRRA